MVDPYAWYWTASAAAHDPPASPSIAILLVVMLTPIIALVVLCIGLSLWDRHHDRSTLTGAERRALAEIARGLRRDDPDLARRLTSVDVIISGDIR
jgi:hypothetical protein